MSNRNYLPTSHRLLSAFPPLAASRASLVAAAGVPPASRNSPPEFAYDSYPRPGSTGGGGGGGSGGGGAGGGGREMASYNRAPPSPANSALSMAYPGVQEFPYGLSGVQMPTYNFGSELYNYVSNGFPRKSRMCTFCNKVFTRSTTRRYHERRCPLLRASNSLAKNEENSSAAASAIKEQQQQQHHQQQQLLQQQQRHKDAQSNSSSLPSPVAPSVPRTLTNSIINSSAAASGPGLPASSSSPPPTLHPAYPTSFPPSSALITSPSRTAATAAAAAYSYAHSYGSHFYNSLSAAALASLDQNSNPLQMKKESDNGSWTSSSPSPSSKLRDHGSVNGLSASAFPKTLMPDSNVDLTARYCADFSIKSQPPVFPPTSLRGPLHSPPSPEPGETGRGDSYRGGKVARSPQEVASRDSVEWSSRDRASVFPEKVPVIGKPASHLKPSPSPPPSLMWNGKHKVESEEAPLVTTVDDEEEDDDDDDAEDEEEMEEDEEQFNVIEASELGRGEAEEEGSGDRKIGPQRGTTYSPLECQFCKKAFSDVVTRKAHEALHAQRKSFACSLCSHAFHCAYSLRIHLLRHHRQMEYQCKYCKDKFKAILELKVHLNSQHALPKSETQSLKYFHLLDGLSEVSAVTPHNTAMSDSEQEVSARSNNGQSVLRRSADSLPEVLNKPTPTTKNCLSNEIEDPASNGHLSNEETEVCKICNKAFAKSFIRFHERAHADQKPYECSICNKRFGYKNNMKSHMKLHQGLKPYQCQICGARFTRGSTLRRHGRRHNISRNSMLDYVLYDHSAGPTRAIGINNKNSMAANVTTNASVSAPFNSHYSRSQPSEPNNKAVNYLQQSRAALMPRAESREGDTYRSSGRSPQRASSPQSLASPRAASNHLTSQAMTNPMVGGLAAVAAANLFAFPATAAPHLYQFYASTNQLMNYPGYTPPQPAPSVQSDALNLSLHGKRKSPFDEDKADIKHSRHDGIQGDKESPVKKFGFNNKVRDPEIKIETEEPGEMVKSGGAITNPFTPHFSPPQNCKTDKILNSLSSDAHKALSVKEPLNISTGDFAVQVNICCPSPVVQSSTGLQPPGAVTSPVGSSNAVHVQARASPSGLSHHSSPANSATSALSPNSGHAVNGENSLQELLLSMLSSGRMFRCSFCDIYFTEYAMFRLHQKYHQCDIARPFLCSVCGEDCKDKTYFTVHLSEHLGLGSKTALA